MRSSELITVASLRAQVEAFELLRMDDVIASLRDELPRWKPNSALVAVDFAMRHGLIGFDEPGYVQIAHLLRAAGSYCAPSQA